MSHDSETADLAEDIPPLTLSIGAVERDTGLSKDTLRMWERRYGFPVPGRDSNGERTYAPDQVEKLRLLARLLALGHRPGKVIALDIARLAALANCTVPARASPAADGSPDPVRLLVDHQVGALRQFLGQALALRGLQRFILEVVAPLTVAVGEAWTRGELQVFEEHLYTEQLQSILRTAIAGLPTGTAEPRVLLTSLPEECHGLGLLMAEGIFAVAGASCIALGTETPVDEIVRAVRAQDSQVLALSFSAYFGARRAMEGLAQLRSVLPPAVEIWAGGSAVDRLRGTPDGIRMLPRLEDISPALQQWRRSRGRSG